MGSQLEDEAAIRSLMDRYGSGVDERDWADFETLFDDPLETDFSGMDASMKPATLSRAAHVAGARAVIGQFAATQHMITNVQVALAGDRARGRATMRAEHWLDGLRGSPRYTMFGVYENGFRRTPQGWRISRLVLRVVREEGNVDVWAEAIRRAQRAGGERSR
jgi:3-phenylpropionate/cinnamic acid dioxygenase small subunit